MALDIGTDAAAAKSAAGGATTEREQWRARRAAMERSGLKYTPFGTRRSRRKLTKPMWDAVGVGLRLIGVGQIGQANALAIGRAEIDLVLPQLPAAFDGFRVLHLTDLHLDGMPGLDEAIATAVAGTAPDLAVLTGDYLWNVGGPFAHVLPSLQRITAAAQPKLGVLATLGNHDPHGIAAAMEALGFGVLVNETTTLRRGDAELHLTGTDDISNFYTDAARRALASAPAGFRIALVHSPELAPEAAAAGHALYLCGHTHGGQVCLPNRVPIATGTKRTPRERALGLWRVGDMLGYTSPGAGTSRLPIRFFSRGEVTLLTLRRGRTP